MARLNPGQRDTVEVSAKPTYDDIAKLALAPAPKSSPAKRKRGQSIKQGAPNKRARTEEAPEKVSHPASPETARSTKPNKLPRPKKLQPIRDPVSQAYPVQKLPRGDIYEVDEGSAERPHPVRTANTKKQRSKERTAQEGPKDAPTSPLSRRKVARRVPTQPAAKAGNHASTIANVRPGAKKKRGRPSKKIDPQAMHSSEEPGSNHTAEVEQSQQQNVIPSKRVGVQQASQERRHEHTMQQDAIEEESQAENARAGATEDPQTSQEFEEDQEAGEEDSEVAPEANDEEDEDELQRDMLGQEDEWKRIVEAARSVSKVPTFTQTIRELRRDIKQARQLYKWLIHTENEEEDVSDEVQEQLQDILDAIEQRIQDIAEPKDTRECSETIQDICCHAIPALVSLTDSAISLRTSEPQGLHRSQSLTEVMRLQGMIERLFTKANLWKSRLSTAPPMRRQIRTIIYPATRDMKKSLEKCLRQIRRDEKIIENRRKTAQKEKASQEMTQNQSLGLTQSRHLPNIRGYAGLEEYNAQTHLESASRRQDRTVTPQMRQSMTYTGPHIWTREETMALIDQLGNPAMKGLPVERRYLAALTAPELQNMLPETIREQALVLKPLMMENPWLRKADWVNSLS